MTASPEKMPLDHAHDALRDEVRLFYNDMLDRDIENLTARQWVEEFRAWLDAYGFERRYEDTLKLIEDGRR